MLTGRQGELLPDWLDAVRQEDLPSLHTLDAGIDRDRDTVIVILTCPGTQASRSLRAALPEGVDKSSW
ncbi:hypothetical protein [Streptomyces sp. NPDC001307]|uniref:hypothetical protein n=1 Tax=Streptomyces sp. NPDC001307 TaxID=3364560 RepID=UPI0036C2F266